MQEHGRADTGALTFPDGWRTTDDGERVAVRVKTKDFLSAVRLIEQVAAVAEELEHHPDIHLTGYNHLHIETYSHDVGKLTERDERLAARVDALIADAGLGKE